VGMTCGTIGHDHGELVSGAVRRKNGKFSVTMA
jgi:hypothetical protein